MHIKCITVLIAIISFPYILYSQEKDNPFRFEPQFKSTQFDATSIYFINTLSASVDFDLTKDKANVASGGFRAGVDYFSTGTVGGSTNGSPCLDYDMLGRWTIDKDFIRIDLCLGGSYHTASKSYYKDDEGLFLKFGGDIKFKFYKNYAGLLIKFGTSKVSYGGIGLFLGYGH
ncbi:MAG: hypothetical protein PHN88_02670 [Ignavibacteria bacterium]|nr:hypothetical protein [Ignavibacteria bacterium]